MTTTDDIKIIISFTDEDKNGELAAYERKDAKETGVINIFINVKSVDVSDMEQVYNALGAELNHYNPSNPYVYDKTEEQVGKGNIQEELFTSIGRNPLDGSGNSFYENILSGSGTLESGNKKYGGISEEYLDFSGGSMCGSNVMYCNEKFNKINKDANTLPLEEFKKKYGESWEKTNDFLMNEIFSEKNNSKNTGTGNNSGKNTTANSGGKTNNTSKGSTVKNCDDECQTDFTNSMNSIGIENSQEKYSYYPAYDPEKAAANAEFRGVLANAGIILMASGVPAGGILVVPKALDYLGGSIYSFQDGDIEGGLQNLAGLATLGIITGSLYQNSNTSLAQTTSKENSKLFTKDGIYILPNNTSLVGVSGNDVGRINYVNGVPSNYYGVVDGKLVMGNVGVESVSNQLFLNDYNGLASITVKYEVSSSALNHASLGEFTYDNRTGAVSKMKGGGHGQDNIDFLEKNGLEVNIVKTYSNGVRIGNVPDHKTSSKRTGENQAWFPETWTNTDIKNAGDYVANLTSNTKLPDGVIMWGEYKGVRVGVIKTNGKPGTIFPDATVQPKK